MPGIECGHSRAEWRHPAWGSGESAFANS